MRDIRKEFAERLRSYIQSEQFASVFSGIQPATLETVRSYCCRPEWTFNRSHILLSSFRMFKRCDEIPENVWMIAIWLELGNMLVGLAIDDLIDNNRRERSGGDPLYKMLHCLVCTLKERENGCRISEEDSSKANRILMVIAGLTVVEFWESLGKDPNYKTYRDRLVGLLSLSGPCQSAEIWKVLKSLFVVLAGAMGQRKSQQILSYTWVSLTRRFSVSGRLKNLALLMFRESVDGERQGETWRPEWIKFQSRLFDSCEKFLDGETIASLSGDSLPTSAQVISHQFAKLGRYSIWFPLLAGAILSEKKFDRRPLENVSVLLSNILQTSDDCDELESILDKKIGWDKSADWENAVVTLPVAYLIESLTDSNLREALEKSLDRRIRASWPGLYVLFLHDSLKTVEKARKQIEIWSGQYNSLVEEMSRDGYDSLWLSEMLALSQIDDEVPPSVCPGCGIGRAIEMLMKMDW